MSKVSFHCVDCGSEDVKFFGANLAWHFEKQVWEYKGDCDDPSYLCSDCGRFNWEVGERDDTPLVSPTIITTL